MPTLAHLPRGLRSIRPAVWLSAVLTGLALVLSACSGQAAAPAGTQPATSQAASASSAAPVSYSKDVLPILQSRCINCHGGQRTQKGLDMTTYAKLMAGGQDGAVVTPGNVDQSSLIQMILQGKMPKNGPKLLPAQIQILTDWVKSGALDN